MTQLNDNNFGLFLPTTYIFDVEQLKDMNVNSVEFKEVILRLYQNVNSIIQTLNLKDSAYYLNQEFATSGQFLNVNNDFNNTRPIFRMVVNFGALPMTGTKQVAHLIPNIMSTYSIISLYGGATNPTIITTAGSQQAFIPLPYSSATSVADNLELSADAQNVYITTGGTDYSDWTTTWVIIEYIKIS